MCAEHTLTMPSHAADLAQPPPKRYRVGELAAHFGLTRQTLHNYARWGLIRETDRTAGGHRLFDETVFARLAAILQLKPACSIEQIRRKLDTDG